MIKFLSNSSTETKKIGTRLGRLLKAGDVVALRGELGSGKTTLAKGIARGLGIDGEKEVASPTFVLIHEYEGREKIFHIDWYRLKAVEQADRLFAEECFSSEAVTLVEWAERGKKILPKGRLEIRLSHKGPDTRLIEVASKGKKYGDLLKALRTR